MHFWMWLWGRGIGAHTPKDGCITAKLTRGVLGEGRHPWAKKAQSHWAWVGGGGGEFRVYFPSSRSAASSGYGSRARKPAQL